MFHFLSVSMTATPPTPGDVTGEDMERSRREHSCEPARAAHIFQNISLITSTKYP
jgi:hypothetical protein